MACALGSVLGRDTLKLQRLIHQTDMMAGQDAIEYYKTRKYRRELAREVIQERRKLDSGLGDRLMDKCVAEQDTAWDGQYRVIIAGALLMRAGARIKPEHMQALRDMVPKIGCNYGFTLPPFDGGFRQAGRNQFLAALDNYVPGTPRDFNVPSCFTCGKTSLDLGVSPQGCSRCKKAWYCNKVGLLPMQRFQNHFPSIWNRPS